jgi:hypothetical protein
VLWESLDEARVREFEAKWVAESEDRIDAFEGGELSAGDGPSAMRTSDLDELNNQCRYL